MKELEGALFEACRTDGGIGMKLQGPIFLQVNGRVFDDKQMAGWKLEDVPEDRLRSRNIREREEVIKCAPIHVCRARGVSKERLDLRCEAEGAVVKSIEEGLDS